MTREFLEGIAAGGPAVQLIRHDRFALLAKFSICPSKFWLTQWCTQHKAGGLKPSLDIKHKKRPKEKSKRAKTGN